MIYHHATRQFYRAVGPNFVCGVEAVNGRIIDTAPLLKRFNGQSVDNLRRWLAKIGGTIEALEEK